MTTDHAQVELGANAIILGDDHGKTGDHIFQSGQALLHVILTVHAQLSGAAAGGDHNGLVSACSNQRSSLYDCMSGAGAEAAGVGAGGTVQAGDLGCSLGEVAAAALIHITASLFGAVDDIFNLILADAGVLHSVQQSQYGRSLGHQIFMHNVRRQVHVDVVCANHAAHQLAVVIQGLSVLIIDQMLQVSLLNAFGNASCDALIDDGVGGESGLGGLDKALFEFHQAEHVASLHQQQELFLRHDLAKLTVTVGHITGLVIPRLCNGCQILGGLVADVNLIGVVSQHLLITAQMIGQFLQILALGIDNALGSLGSTVVQNHIRSMGQNIAGTLNDAFHIVHDLSCHK